LTGAASAFKYVASLTFLTIFVAVFLAGAGVFGATSDFDAHKIVGTVVQAETLVLATLALVGRVWRAPSVVLFALAVIQGFLVHFSSGWLKALHLVNALLIYGLVAYLAHAAWTRRTPVTTRAA
jgi:uncharacterized protein DUF6220